MLRPKRLLTFWKELPKRVVKKIINASAMLRGDGKNGNAERMKRRSVGFLRRRVHFVNCKDERFPRSAQKTRQLFIERSQSRLAVHHENEQSRLLNGDLRLTKDFLRDERFLVRNNAAGVHHFQSFAAPFRFAVDAVASDAGLVGNDGAPRARQAVEQRGLAHVGASDNDQRWQSRGHEFDLWRNPPIYRIITSTALSAPWQGLSPASTKTS